MWDLHSWRGGQGSAQAVCMSPYSCGQCGTYRCTRCWRRWTCKRASSWWPWRTMVIMLLSIPAIMGTICHFCWKVDQSRMLRPTGELQPKLDQQQWAHWSGTDSAFLWSNLRVAADDGSLSEVAGKSQKDFYSLFWILVLKAIWDGKHDQQVTCCPVIVTTMDQMFVSPQNSMFKSWDPMWQYTEMGPWKIVRFRWGHGGWAPWDVISALIRRGTRELLFLPVCTKMHQVSTLQQGSHLQAGREFSPSTWIGWHLDLGLTSYQTMRNKFPLFKPPSPRHFVLFCQSS